MKDQHLCICIAVADRISGVAFYDQECMWSCHSEFGLWFVYRYVSHLIGRLQGTLTTVSRAAVVFNVEIDGFAPSVPEPVLTPQIIAVRPLSFKFTSTFAHSSASHRISRDGMTSL
jgi:hypothetical protein